jgi:3',5'-cyclic AMP phosphodiesterase CpdA/ActR/RegA family two-component response regulator
MGDLNRYTILVVDDNPSWRDLVCRVLEEYTIVPAASKADAFKAILIHQSTRFDVAIIDQNLLDTPGDVSGLSLAKDIKSKMPDCQIIVLTGYADVPSVKLALQDIGVSDYLEKYPDDDRGFDITKLRETVYKAILSRSQPSQRQLEVGEVREAKSATVSILHLSDLHFGEYHRFYLDRNYPARDAPSLQKALIAGLEVNRISPDIIVVSGDLAEKGDFAEFEQARTFLTALAEHFKLTPNRFIMVPGNHDVRWSEDGRRDQMTEYGGFYELWYGKSSAPQSPFTRVELYRFHDRPNVAIVGFDSCVIENPKTAGVGYIGTSQLRSALDDLKHQINESADCIKIAVLHHHLVPVTYLEQLPGDKKNFSLVVDATRVLARLQEEGFCLVLHGHQHQPFYAEFRLPLLQTSTPKPITILGMGSTGIKPSPELVGNVRNNYFSLIEISLEASTTRTQAKVSWYRAAGNEPEEMFEFERDFSFPVAI